jgi:hypothetical protein
VQFAHRNAGSARWSDAESSRGPDGWNTAAARGWWPVHKPGSRQCFGRPLPATAWFALSCSVPYLPRRGVALLLSKGLRPHPSRTTMDRRSGGECTHTIALGSRRERAKSSPLAAAAGNHSSHVSMIEAPSPGCSERTTVCPRPHAKKPIVHSPRATTAVASLRWR